MSQLAQKSKYKQDLELFKQVCPKWAEIFRITDNMSAVQITDQLPSLSEQIEKVFGADIGEPDRCVIGEAHGWTDKYNRDHRDAEYCGRCDDLSFGFDDEPGFVSAFMNPQERPRTISVFADHWRSEHLK